MPRFIVISNLKASIIALLYHFLHAILIALAGFYIADAWNSTGFAVLIVLFYLGLDATLDYLADGSDVVFLEKREQEEDDEEEVRS